MVHQDHLDQDLGQILFDITHIKVEEAFTFKSNTNTCTIQYNTIQLRKLGIIMFAT